MRKFNTAVVAQVTGVSISLINEWARKNQKKVKDGLTASDVMDFLKASSEEKSSGMFIINHHFEVEE